MTLLWRPGDPSAFGDAMGPAVGDNCSFRSRALNPNPEQVFASPSSHVRLGPHFSGCSPSPDSQSETLVRETLPHGRHVFLCFKQPSEWPSSALALDWGLMPRALRAAVQTADAAAPHKTMLTVCEGRDDGAAGCYNGDVLLFPDMLLYRGLTRFDVQCFAEEALLSPSPAEPEKGRLRPEPLHGCHIFVCCQSTAGSRCGVRGLKVADRFTTELSARGVPPNEVRVWRCCHLSNCGQPCQGNVVVFGGGWRSRCAEGNRGRGQWYTTVMPEDVGEIVDSTVLNGQVVTRLWSGTMEGVGAWGNGWRRGPSGATGPGLSERGALENKEDASWEEDLGKVDGVGPAKETSQEVQWAWRRRPGHDLEGGNELVRVGPTGPHRRWESAGGSCPLEAPALGSSGGFARGPEGGSAGCKGDRETSQLLASAVRLGCIGGGSQLGRPRTPTRSGAAAAPSSTRNSPGLRLSPNPASALSGLCAQIDAAQGSPGRAGCPVPSASNAAPSGADVVHPRLPLKSMELPQHQESAADVLGRPSHPLVGDEKQLPVEALPVSLVEPELGTLGFTCQQEGEGAPSVASSEDSEQMLLSIGSTESLESKESERGLCQQGQSPTMSGTPQVFPTLSSGAMLAGVAAAGLTAGFVILRLRLASQMNSKS